MDLEGILSGENLAFYKNIKDLKVLTANARALITRSHAVYKDILQGHEFKRPVRGTDQSDDLSPLELLDGECFTCRLLHGAHDFCIVQEIFKAEKKNRESQRKSATILPLQSNIRGEHVEALYSQQPKSPKESPKEPSRGKVKEWEDLLYREMTPEELDSEYSRICHVYGVANGRKFLLARSLAREPEKVQPLFTHENQHTMHRNKNRKGNFKIASVVRDCIPENKLDFPQPCVDFSPDVRYKMASVIDLELPCKFKAPKMEKLWKNALKAKPKSEAIQQDTIEDDFSIIPSDNGQSSTSRAELCDCGLDVCDCDIQSMCNPPEKKCLTVTDYQNNYLFTVREKMKKHELLRGKTPPPEYHQISYSSSREVSCDILRKDSEVMMKKAYALREKDLRTCLASAIGKGDANLNEHVSKIAKLTSDFMKPDEKAWDQWIESFQAQEAIEEDEGISGDSDIPSTCSNSMTASSTTDWGFQNPQPGIRRIPFVEEPLKMVDILFNKIYARFKKSIQKNSISSMLNPCKRLFFSHVDHLMSWTGTDTIGSEVVDKLNLYFRYLKSLKPKKLLSAQRLKRLDAKNKQLSKTIRRRNYIEGRQVGKYYGRSRKSVNFTKDQGYIGFKAAERTLLQKPTPERFASCNLVGEGSGVLLSKKRIHYHYRLLRTLFNGTMQGEDRGSLMDEGMRERLQKFKETLHKNSRTQFGTDSDTENESASVLKAASVPIRIPPKREEKKLKSSQGCLPHGTRSSLNSCTLSSRLNDYGNEPSLYDEEILRSSKTPSYKSSSKRIINLSQSAQPEVPKRPVPSNGSAPNSYNHWDDYTNAPSLLEGSLPRASKKSSQRWSSSKQITNPTRSDQMEVPTRTLLSQSNMSKESSDTHSLYQWETFHLPTPPLSESSCGEIEFDLIQHRVPPKEEAHIEKSARLDARTRKKHAEENISNPQLHVKERRNVQQLDESELTDKSSDSYVPRLLKVPPKRISGRPVSLRSHTHRGRSYHKTIKGRAAYSSGSSSTDTEPVNPLHNIDRERAAWDHKSGPNRKIAPYLDTQTHFDQNNATPTSRPHKVKESQRTNHEKSAFTPPLPKARPSILKKHSLPKPPSDGTSENQSKKHAVGMNPVQIQSFSDSSYRTTSLLSEGLVKPARIVTERLLKARQENPEADLPAGSTKKPSAQSRATPDAVPNSSISFSASRKTSGAALIGVSKSGQAETNDGPSPRQRLSVTVKPSKSSSASYRPADSSPDETASGATEPNQLRKTNSLSASSSKRFSKRLSNKIANEVFRRRSLVPSERLENKEPQPKAKVGKKAVADDILSLKDGSISSIGIKLKKLEAIGPTKRRCFNLDIGQGINCVNYLKENAPGADEIKKKELVDLLVTPVEVKKAPKKVAAKVDKDSSLENATSLVSQQCARESSSLTSANQSSKTMKSRDQALQNEMQLRKTSFKTLDQIYKEVHGINKNNTPPKLVDNDYEYEVKKRQQLTKHKIFP